MAQYQNGQGYLGQSPNQYGSQPHPHQPHQLRRTPSFNNGDDASYFSPSSGGGDGGSSGGHGPASVVSGGGAAHLSGSAVGRQDDELFLGHNSPVASHGSRSSYGSPAFSGYLSQNQNQLNRYGTTSLPQRPAAYSPPAPPPAPFPPNSVTYAPDDRSNSYSQALPPQYEGDPDSFSNRSKHGSRSTRSSVP